MLLTAGLGAPAIAAALASGRLHAALVSAILAAAGAAVQWLVALTGWRARVSSGRVTWLQLTVAIVLAAILIELVIPASFSLYIPVVGLAAAIGIRQGLVIASIAGVLYLLPVFVHSGPIDQTLFARAMAGVAISALVAAGARFYVSRLERVTAELREGNARERARLRQIAGIEAVGRSLAAGPTTDALSKVMDVLVERFGYQYVSIYLAQPDGSLHLGAQRGYDTTVDQFDGTSGVVGRVMRTREPELIRDVATDPEYVSANADVTSEICAPLIVGGEFLGIVNVESVGRRLDPTDLRLVTSVADSLATYVALGRERERLADLAVRDPLTGVHNRRYLDDSLRRLFAARARQHPLRRDWVSIILFDLDHFGQLNKQYGLAVGDEALRAFGRLLADRFREADLVARYGGEEFLVVLVDARLADAERRGDDLRQAFAAKTKELGQPVTVSAGCSAMAPDDVSDPESLIATADAALSMAKRSGRDRVVAAG
ncbi:MAG TPA: sensor domain-containing diguanylate cyclase [Candidatus Limnocylindrales bacterium]|nr:sensor domain-containing diguanylate cyclase [Candidatus Limnocylindrales bacterium]